MQRVGVAGYLNKRSFVVLPPKCFSVLDRVGLPTERLAISIDPLSIKSGIEYLTPDGLSVCNLSVPRYAIAMDAEISSKWRSGVVPGQPILQNQGLTTKHQPNTIALSRKLRHLLWDSLGQLSHPKNEKDSMS